MKQSHYIILLVVLCVAVYFSSLHTPFIYDYQSNIINNNVIKNLDNFYANPSGYNFNPTKFIGNLTLAVNYRLGGLDTTGYHIFNILVHLINVLLVYLLVSLTFKTPVMRGASISSYSSAIAFTAAAVFAVHPVQTSAVTLIIQRFVSLATLFYLAALCLYIKMRLLQQEGAAPLKKTLPLYLLSLLMIVLAMKTKAVSATLPLTMILYEFSFFKRRDKKELLYLVPVILTLPIVPLSLLHFSKPVEQALSDLGGSVKARPDYFAPGISRWDYLVTEFSVITTYIRLIFLPVNLNFDHDYPVYHSLFAPRVLLSFLFLAALFALAVYLFKKSSKGDPDSRLVAFGIFWFFIALSVESSIMPINDVINEYRVYLPSIGAFIAVTGGAVILVKKYFSRKGLKKLAVLSAVVVIALSAATIARNSVWASDISLWGDTVKKSPNKARPLNNLGIALSAAGRQEEAVLCYRKAIAIEPTADEYNNLGNAYDSLGMADFSIEQYEKAIRLDPQKADSYNNLGRVLLTSKNDVADAVSLFLKAIELKPDLANAYVNLSAAYNRAGRFADTIRLYRNAPVDLSGQPQMRFNLCIAFLAAGDYNSAMNELAAVRSLDPRLASGLEDYLLKQRPR